MGMMVDKGYRLLAAKYIRKQAKQLARQLDGVRKADDVEYVHQARVATRRLRAAMRLFRDCFDAAQLKLWRKRIKRVTSALGDARDKDVQIEYLWEVLDTIDDKALLPGIARLAVRLERRRERLQPEAVVAVDRLASSGTLDDMRKTAKRILSKGKRRKRDLRSRAGLAQSERHVLSALDDLRSYEDSLADPEAVDRHHAMRIAAKRLRYTVEIVRPLYEGRLDDVVDDVKKVQSLLGDVHDCDVWLGDLEAFADAERNRIVARYGHAGPMERLTPGIQYLSGRRREQRQEVFGELVRHWQELNRQGFWEKLVNTVQPRRGLFNEPEVHAPPADRREIEEILVAASVPAGPVRPKSNGRANHESSAADSCSPTARDVPARRQAELPV